MTSSERSRLMVLIVLLAVLAGVPLYRHLRGVVAAGAVPTAAQLAYKPQQGIPDLKAEYLERSEAAGDGFARNPFVYGSPPTPTRDLRPTPTPPPTPTPRPPPPTRTPGPSPTPLPPPFDRTYIGYLGPSRLPVAVFRKGDELEVAPVGAILDQRFVLRQVGFESVVIGFVGYPEEVTTRVPLAEN